MSLEADRLGGTAVVGIASLLVGSCPGKAVELLTVVQAQSSSEYNSVATSGRLLLQLAADVPAESYAVCRRGR